MAPNLLSPFIAQTQTRHSAIKMDLKEAVATVFDGDLDPRHVISYTTPISSVSICNKWYYPNIYGFVGSKELVSMHDTRNGDAFQAKHLTHDAILARFDPYMYALDGLLTGLFKNHWTLYVYDLHNKRIQLLDSRPGRKRSCMSGNNKIGQGCSIACCDKKEMVAVDLNMYSFVMPTSMPTK
ncbi:hypothetical protein CK203_076180 [Vitis vinifera]|uniref:Ubiquitin-like protease family profile domain-containing protein n=1 Tax=Vitis vinifera TaxID=29760 RepID=A0A438EE67_VITVI|nr:hypothetical protein CK203_076180 [Vitis vinifera]